MRKWFWSLLMAVTGLLIGMWWLRERDAVKPTLRTTETPATPPDTPTVEATSPVAEPQDTPPDIEAKPASDDLTAVSGIGAAFEQALNALGVYTYAQLAEQDPADLAERINARGVTAERIERDAWITQAAALRDANETKD